MNSIAITSPSKIPALTRLLRVSSPRHSSPDSPRKQSACRVVSREPYTNCSPRTCSEHVRRRDARSRRTPSAATDSEGRETQRHDRKPNGNRQIQLNRRLDVRYLQVGLSRQHAGNSRVRAAAPKVTPTPTSGLALHRVSACVGKRPTSAWCCSCENAHNCPARAKMLGGSRWMVHVHAARGR